MEICKHDLCTGCGLCAEVCSKQCINMIENNEGFLYPVINENQCISCNLCKKKCPINLLYEIKNKTPEVILAGWSNVLDERFTSSSGGIFPELAKYVLEKNGTVYGAAYKDNFDLIHIRVATRNELYKLKGSKYFQSDIRNIYKNVKEDLIKGLIVLFSGTGCQINAIYNYLNGINTSNLITVEILCHGVPSKKCITSYIKDINSSSKLKELVFRDKKVFGWKYSCVFSAKFEDSSQHYGRSSTDPFYLGFLQELFLRESCYQCHYTGTSRIGDITLADYWDVDKEHLPSLKPEDLQNGVSLILANKKGYELLSKLLVDGKIVFYNADLKHASLHNQALKGSYKRPINRDKFFKLNDKYGYKKTLFLLYPTLIIGIKFRNFIKRLIGMKNYEKMKHIFLKGY